MTATIDDQLELERNMVQRGIESYYRAVQQANEKGRGADTATSRRLIGEFINPLAEAVTAWANVPGPAQRGNLRKLIKIIDPHKAVYITLKALFNSFTMEAPIHTTAVKIGTMIEDELRFSRFQEQHADYYKAVLDDFKRKGTNSYQHKHRVLAFKANEKEDKWESWATTDRAQVGVKMMDFVLENTDLIEKRVYHRNGKTIIAVVPTKAADEWIEQNHELRSMLFPDKMPCIIPPADWENITDGGYYTPEMRKSQPFLKTVSKEHRKRFNAGDRSKVFEAVNSLQRIPWRVNEQVLEVMRIVWAKNLRIGMPASQPLKPPPSPFEGKDRNALTEREQEQLNDWKHEAAEVYAQEKERVAKSYQVSRIMRVANEYAGKPFYFVWYTDFRGRMYTATATFSPQGPDLAKGLLQFEESKPLGDTGLYWLKVNIANKFGYDKVSLDDRVRWVDENTEHFRRAAMDPISYRDVWANADKPWQFLAAILEYHDILWREELGFPHQEYQSRTIVGLDGSCNGLQNFSAMLRDEVGGKATNLVPSDKPADIYSEVARVCATKLRNMQARVDRGEELEDYTEDDYQRLREWISFMDKYGKGSIPRKMAKRPVMTLPYGATRQSCTTYIFSSLIETDKEHFSKGNFKAATYLTKYLWNSIGDVVIAARHAMAWLQKTASALTKEQLPIDWTTPDGFYVYQAQYKQEQVIVRTQLAGAYAMRINQPTNELCPIKQRNSVAPNFVHSCDGAHLRETVRRMKDKGVTNIAAIHDDYGTHACDTGVLHKVIREAFVYMYGEIDVLETYRAQHFENGVEFPELPPVGKLDLQVVLGSEYFFA